MIRTHLLRSGARGRRGFTLIELLVVMAIITALGLLALMLLPGINNSDAALKATEEVRAQHKIAQALAASSRQPRGVRMLVGARAPLGTRYATEIQLVESPPVTVIDPLTLVAKPAPGDTTGVFGPRVEIFYDLAGGTNTSNPPRGTITLRHCRVYQLTQDQYDQVQPGALLHLPTLGNFWSRINSRTDVGNSTDGAGVTRYDIEVVLDFYPDSFMGASTHFRTYHAGIYGTPVPLVGQPTIPLPSKTAIDLDISSPAIQPLNAAGDLPNYDVMFAPDGQTISVAGRTSSAGVYLWVRDVTKNVNPGATGGIPNTSMVPSHFGGQNGNWASAFRLGGEHHAVGINNGFVGTAPIQWPDAGGQYSEGPGITYAFTFVRKRTN